VIGVRTSAILATHTFGTPCDVEGLQQIAVSNGIHLFFDAAHAFGSRYRGRPVGGLGDAEVFSLSPTKVLVAGEGGLIATNDDLLAERCRIGRDYANPGDYDSRFVGLNARMSEFHALMALHSLVDLDERIDRRNQLAAQYVELLGTIPGLSFPKVPEGDRTTYKDFTTLVDPEAFGMDAVGLGEALEAEGIATKRYYAPPVHRQRAYRTAAGVPRPLPVTAAAAARVLTLPLWSETSDQDLLTVCTAVDRIQRFVSGRPSGQVVLPSGGRWRVELDSGGLI
jgi:dTDP-4-amino-4,6-dideoxygalactose transaminase